MTILPLNQIAGVPDPLIIAINTRLRQISQGGAGTTTDTTVVEHEAPGGAASLGPLESSFSGSHAQNGVPYSGGFNTVGGTPPYSYALTSGSLPAGLSLNATTGAITGTPLFFTSETFVVTVKDLASDMVGVTCTITVATASTPVATSDISSVTAGEVGGARNLRPDQTTHTLIEVEPTWAGSYGLQSLTIWLYFRRASGTAPAWYWNEVVQVLATGTAIAAFLDVLIVNGASVAAQVAVLPGSYPGDSTVPLTLGALPTGAVLSSTFPLYLSNPLATGASAVTLSTPANMGVNADGLVYFSLNLTVTTPGNGDPNCWFYQSTLEWQDSLGNPDPGGNGEPSGENLWTTYTNDGTTSTRNLLGNYSSSATYNYLRVKLYGISRNGTANPNFSDATAVTQTCFPGSANNEAILVSLSVVSVPPVTNFAAGQSNGNGTFTAMMYWDDLISALHVDFGCLAPSDVTNWSGVAIWAKAPSVTDPTGFVFTQLTDIYALAQFTSSASASGTVQVLFDTIAISLASVPAAPESWIFIATSYDHQGNRANDISGAPTGPAVTLETLANQEAPVQNGQLNLHTSNPETVGDNLSIAFGQLNVTVGAGLTSVANAITVNVAGALNTIGNTLNLSIGPALTQLDNTLALQLGDAVGVLNGLLDVLPGKIGPQQISTVNASQINSLDQSFATFLGTATINATQVNNLTQTIGTFFGTATFTVGQITNFTASVTSVVGTLSFNAGQVTGLTATINTLIGSATFTVGQVTNFTASVATLIGSATFSAGQITNFDAAVAVLVGTLTINVSQITGVFQLNIGSFAGTLNVGAQVADGTINISKLTVGTMFVSGNGGIQIVSSLGSSLMTPNLLSLSSASGAGTVQAVSRPGGGGELDALYSGSSVSLIAAPSLLGVFVNGNQVLSTRVATRPVVLADVIALLVHHGLSA